MASSAIFTFYGALSDFLPKNRKDLITYSFNGNPSVKDAVETIGVPHVEVDVILVNQISVDFTYQLCGADELSIYPKNYPVAEVPVIHLIESVPAIPSFILDVHLGKLARLLRMLGLNTLYDQNFADAQIAEIAAATSRIVLTRDIALLKRKSVKWGYWLRSRQPEVQLPEVIAYFDLLQFLQPFYRCITCNSLIQKVDKKQIIDSLHPQTHSCFEEFYQCSGCHKVYWKGSHYQKMEQFVAQLYRNFATEL
jgi:uncharacterized protein with PIN domain